MEFLKGLSRAMKNAQENNTFDEFGHVAGELARCRDQAREALQAKTADQIQGVIQKLEKNESLTPEEKEYVKLWVVGDAAGYVKLATSLKEWQGEFQRLTALVEAYEGKTGTVPDLVDLHGVLEDAAKVAGNVAHFLEDQERLQRFEKAITHLEAADNKFIADILKSKLNLPDM